MLNLLDTQASLLLAGWRSGALTDFFQLITAAGDKTGVVFVLGLVFVVAVYWRRWRPFVFITGGTVLAWLLRLGLKLFFLRGRPDNIEALVGATGYSFPSGHAIVSLVLFGLIALAVGETRLGRRHKTFIFSIAAIAIVLVGVSRVYLGVHFLSDVLGGWIFGFIILVLIHRQAGGRLVKSKHA